jgi:hypothetical protein
MLAGGFEGDRNGRAAPSGFPLSLTNLILLRKMKECLECRRLEIHIKNLERGFCTQKLKAVSGGHSIVDKDRRYEYLLRLSHELETKRRELKQHRKTHFTIH